MWTDLPKFSNCAFSDDEPVTLYEWDIVSADKITYNMGDGTTTNCSPGQILAPHNADLLHKVILPMLYGEQKE